MPSHRFHLVISTVGRLLDLERLLDSVEAQQQSVFITLVEQNEEPTCANLIAPWVARGDASYIHEPVVRGLSRGRNAGLRELRGQIIAFPDDDCWYPQGLLKNVSDELSHTGRDGLSVRLAAENGKGNLLRWLPTACSITPRLIPRTVTSATLFLSHDLVKQVGGFDPELGSGSGTPFGAAEETDFVLRALKDGRTVDYLPQYTVFHEEWREGNDRQQVRSKVRHYNRGFGRVLRKHRQFSQFSYWGIRSAVGILVRLCQRDRLGAEHQMDQLLGRVQGWIAPRP